MAEYGEDDWSVEDFEDPATEYFIGLYADGDYREDVNMGIYELPGFGVGLDMDEKPLTQTPVLSSVNPGPGPSNLCMILPSVSPMSPRPGPSRLTNLSHPRSPSPSSPGLLAIKLGTFTTPQSDDFMSIGSTIFWNGREFDGMKVVEGLARRDPSTYKKLMEEHGIAASEDMPVAWPPEPQSDAAPTPVAPAIEPAPNPEPEDQRSVLTSTSTLIPSEPGQPAEFNQDNVTPVKSETPEPETVKPESEQANPGDPGQSQSSQSNSKELPEPGTVLFMKLSDGRTCRCVVVLDSSSGEKKLLMGKLLSSDVGHMIKSGCNVTPLTLRPLATPAGGTGVGVPAQAHTVWNNDTNAIPTPASAASTPKPPQSQIPPAVAGPATTAAAGGTGNGGLFHCCQCGTVLRNATYLEQHQRNFHERAAAAAGRRRRGVRGHGGALAADNSNGRGGGGPIMSLRSKGRGRGHH